MKFVIEANIAEGAVDTYGALIELLRDSASVLENLLPPAEGSAVDGFANVFKQPRNAGKTEAMIFELRIDDDSPISGRIRLINEEFDTEQKVTCAPEHVIRDEEDLKRVANMLTGKRDPSLS